MDKMRYKDVFAGRRVFVGGHRNFTGGWMSLFLETLGADICGLSKPRKNDSLHYSLLNVEMLNHEGETNEFDKVRGLMNYFQPSIVFHTAEENTETTINAACSVDSVEGIVVLEREKRPNLGKTYSKPVAFCRVEELIGGGDFTEGRLFPELAKAASRGDSARIRGESGTRSWHHVLDAVSGCFQIAMSLLENGRKNSGPWTLDTSMAADATIEGMVSLAFREWKAIRTHSISEYAPERLIFELGPKRLIPGSPLWTLEESVQETVEWYRAYHENGKVKTLEQIEEYMLDTERMESILRNEKATKAAKTAELARRAG